MSRPVGPGPCPQCNGPTERWLNGSGELYFICSKGYAESGNAGRCGYRSWNEKNLTVEQTEKR